jgi:hypothetical protein
VAEFNSAIAEFNSVIAEFDHVNSVIAEFNSAIAEFLLTVPRQPHRRVLSREIHMIRTISNYVPLRNGPGKVQSTVLSPMTSISSRRTKGGDDGMMAMGIITTTMEDTFVKPK